MLKVNDITFSYSRRRKPVLENFSLSISEGGVYGLLGSNGAGKSTLLYLITGLLTPDSGSVSYNGLNTRRRLPESMADLFIVPEEIDFPSMSLMKYAEINGAFYPNFSMEQLLDNLALFEITPQMNIGRLSMGQKKKVALSFAMACNTRLLLLDEPTNGLDIPGKAAFRRFIAASESTGRIIIISTHQVRDVAQILDHVLIIDNRRVLFDHSTREIQSRLKFLDTVNPALIDRAIYATSSPIGSSIILPNTDGEDTEINLELLFNFAHEEPETLSGIFDKSR
ncbi:MAG: ABC transporter ATP-binding protein [Muribaculaceae bacterium]|nr:ABC transporter ATP-binding protein [Muribaculaceae bacterium]MDE7081874.1 ABC transporter ATP-binding protein [Muribaculaceae bacterium]